MHAALQVQIYSINCTHRRQPTSCADQWVVEYLEVLEEKSFLTVECSNFSELKHISPEVNTISPIWEVKYCYDYQTQNQFPLGKIEANWRCTITKTGLSTKKPLMLKHIFSFSSSESMHEISQWRVYLFNFRLGTHFDQRYHWSHSTMHFL